MIDYLEVTELSGTEVSTEQIERLTHRYIWASKYCIDKDVVEVACGTGQGLGILNKNSKTLKAGDYSQPMVEIAKKHYKDRITIESFDALNMPYADNSLDVIIIFEALYYLPDVDKFLEECRRVLRGDGCILIATANKDLFDFNPSPHSHKYYAVIELGEILGKHNFTPSFFGYLDVRNISVRQRMLRPIRKLAILLGLMPKTMKSKKLLKRIVFGKAKKMPEEVLEDMLDYVPPEAIDSAKIDDVHKVIYCEAKLT